MCLCVGLIVNMIVCACARPRACSSFVCCFWSVGVSHEGNGGDRSSGGWFWNRTIMMLVMVREVKMVEKKQCLRSRPPLFFPIISSIRFVLDPFPNGVVIYDCHSHNHIHLP